MKIKRWLFITCLIGQCFIVSAQQYATEKKATIIAGRASFMSSGGAIFEDFDGNKTTNFNITPVISHFITNNFYVGGRIEIAAHSQGNGSSNAIGVGPHLGYMFGGPQSTALPFLDLGIDYYKMNIDYAGEDSVFLGSNIALGFGVIIPVKTHIGLVFDGEFNVIDLKDRDSNDTMCGNIFSIGIGIVGLLFQSEM